MLTSLRRLSLILLPLLVAGGGVYLVFIHPLLFEVGPAMEEEQLVPDAPPPDPRLQFETIFRNVKPDVQYVGDAKCKACHAEICTTYHAHPMGRSAVMLGPDTTIEAFEAKSNNPFKLGPYELSSKPVPQGQQHTISAKDSRGESLPGYHQLARVALGSGTRGRSYLNIEDGAVWQTPHSWFGPNARWDVSPGFDLGNGGRRAIIPDCLFCHLDRVEPIPQAVNRYREPLISRQAAIGCERCHGPGELHVQERLSNLPMKTVDDSIVNPKHLSSSLQASICAQCHLQGQERIARRGRSATEFRPGLPFELFMSVFVRHPDIADPHKSVGHFEQLDQSQCRLTDGHGLICTSCHDPHKSPSPAERDAHYRNKCLTCHDTKGCTTPLAARTAKQDNCTTCHMPKASSSTIAHTSVTDHRILRKQVAESPPPGLKPGTVPLVPFGSPGEQLEPELERDLGLALSRWAKKLPPGSASQQVIGNMAKERLQAALKRDPGDSDAWLAMSRAYAAAREQKERLTCAANALMLAPNSDAALVEVSEAALELGDWTRAEGAATQLIDRNPHSVDYRLSRATIRVSRQDWPAAASDAEAALKIHPLHPMARLIHSACLYRQGQREAGRTALETAIALAMQPEQKAAFRDWFRERTR